MSVEALELDDTTFEDAIDRMKGGALVDFGAEWCGPCRQMAPAVEALAAELAGKVKIAKVDVDKAGETAARFGVTSLPCLILFKDGQEIDRATGARSKGQIKQWIESKLA